jgi:hypothetical protein
MKAPEQILQEHRSVLQQLPRDTDLGLFVSHETAKPVNITIRNTKVLGL